MLDTKTRNEILLEEKIAKIDDINFDKIYNVEEFATKQIENFNEVDPNLNIDVSNEKQENSFEIEVETNEFLDNFQWNKEEIKTKKEKLKINNKLLLFTFTSIAALLCILLIYNVFVINSLTLNLKNAQNLKINNSYNTSKNYEEENNYILLENSSQIEVENFNSIPNTSYNMQQEVNMLGNEFEQTNWFDKLISQIGTLFGG